MTKGSTAAGQQRRKFSQQKLTVGLDLGDRNSWYCVMDEAGQIQRSKEAIAKACAFSSPFSGVLR